MTDTVNSQTPDSATDAVTETVAEATPGSVTVSVNGAARVLTGPVTLDILVATLTTAPSGVAAALNETVVPRGRWSATTLSDGDRVEVLTAVQGG